jgi:hypothetical protein
MSMRVGWRREVADVYLATDYPEAATPATPTTAFSLSREALQKRIGCYYSPQSSSALSITMKRWAAVGLPGPRQWSSQPVDGTRESVEVQGERKLAPIRV